MDGFLPIKKSQLSFYRDTPLFYLSDRGEGVLFKKPGLYLTWSQVTEAREMELYILEKDRDAALKEAMEHLNLELARKIASKGVSEVRAALCLVVEEALSGMGDVSSRVLPETIEILFKGYSRQPHLSEALLTIHSNAPVIVEHSVNVLALSMLYCLNEGFDEAQLKNIGLAALLHDIGTTRIDRSVISKQDRLTDREFESLKRHPSKGYALLKQYVCFDEMVPRVALEHHEKLDGSGYPAGTGKISFEGQLIGLIDSYEPLTYRSKTFREAKKPFEALSILKQEVLDGKYSPEIFKNFCSCLIK